MAERQARRGFLFTRSHWLPDTNSDEGTAILRFMQAQDALGRRMYIQDVLDTVRAWLPLMDRDDTLLPDFVQELVRELDDHGLAVDRRALATLLDAL